MEQVGIEFSIITDKASQSTSQLTNAVLALDNIVTSAKDTTQIMINKLAETDYIRSLSENIDEAKENVDDLNLSILDLVKAQLIADTIKGVFNSIVNGAKASIPEIGQSFGRMNSIINTNFYAPLKTAVIPVLQELEKFIIENQEIFRMFGGVVANIFNMIVGVVKYTIDIISNIYTNTFGKIFGGLKDIANSVSEYMNFALLKIAFLFTAIQVILEPILEEIGNKLLWVFNEIAIPSANKFIEVISFISEALEDPKQAIDDFDTSTTVLASGGLTLLTIGVLALGKSLITTMIPAIISATISTYAFTTALLSNPIVLITVGVMALVGSLVLLYKNWDEISNIIPESINSISDSFNSLYNDFNEYISSMGERVSEIFTGIKNTIIESITNAINFVMEYINPFINKISSIVSKVGSIKNLFSDSEESTNTQPVSKTDNTDLLKSANIRNDTTIENKNTYNIQSTEPEAVAKEIEKLENKKSKLSAKQEYNKYAPAMGYY